MATDTAAPAWKAVPKTQAESAIVAAGDRSISPEMMTSVRTSATMRVFDVVGRALEDEAGIGEERRQVRGDERRADQQQEASRSRGAPAAPASAAGRRRLRARPGWDRVVSVVAHAAASRRSKAAHAAPAHGAVDDERAG